MVLVSGWWSQQAPGASPVGPAGPETGERIAALVGAGLILAVVVPLMMSLPEDASGSAESHAGSRLEAAPAETIVAGYGGVSHTHASDVHFKKPGVTDLTAHDVQWIGRPFKSPIYYGIRIIRWPESQRVGAMLDFTHAKAIAERSQNVRFSGTRNGQPMNETRNVGETFRHLEFSHGHNMLTLNGLLRLGGLMAGIRPYVGVGAGISLPHTEVQFRDEPKRTYEYQFTGGVTQALAGLELRLAKASIFVEYKFSYAPYHAPLSGHNGTQNVWLIDWWGQLTRWWRGEAPEFGYLRTRLASHHFIAGAGYRHTTVAPAAP